MRPPIRTALVVAAGIACTAVAAYAGGIPAKDALVLGGIAFGVGLVVLGIGLAVVHGRSDTTPRSLQVRTAVVAAIPIVTVLAGAIAAARVMFVSDHDLKALLIVIAGAGTAGMLAALDLADQLARARREVADGIARQQRLERSRRELVAWVSHDLRTPLAGLRAMSEALADGVVSDPESVERYHRNLQRESERLARLVDDLFELSRLEVNEVELTIERVSLGDLVSDAVATATAIADAKGVELIGRLAGPPPVLDLSSPEMLRVVHNLLDNAIRHTASGGRVEVEVSTEGMAGVVSVLDGCGGIDPQHAEHVFDLAFRADPARSPEPDAIVTSSGGGFGLAIARGFVEAHGGRIDHHNEGPGCRFTVRLPLPRADEPARAAAAASNRA